jgi:hypothetical protein
VFPDLGGGDAPVKSHRCIHRCGEFLFGPPEAASRQTGSASQVRGSSPPRPWRWREVRT